MKFLPAVIFMFSSLVSTGQTSTLQLQEKIDSIFKSTQGDFAIAFKDLSEEKDSILINPHKDFHAASTMKTPVMIEVFKQAAEGKFSLHDSLIIQN